MAKKYAESTLKAKLYGNLLLCFNRRFWQKSGKKTDNKKKKRSARSTPYHTARVKSWKFVLEQDPSTLVKSPCTQKI